MRVLVWLLVILLLLLQYPLWLGKGSWPKVWSLKEQIETVKLQNRRLTDRNQRLRAEVLDLSTGYDSIEARARNELGMIRKNEVFYQVMEPVSATPSGSGERE